MVRSERGGAVVVTAAGTVQAKYAAALLKESGAAVDLPVVGDWVVVHADDELEAPLIEAVLDRSSAIVRGDSGETSGQQALAANVDVVFVVHPLVPAPNVRRIERELALAWESGATPVVLLTKVDLSADVEAAIADVSAVAFGVDVITSSAVTGAGLDLVRAYLVSGHTGVLIGPSGAGKSTLVNALLGEQRQATREVRLQDGRGRHTTVTRELIALADDGLLIDTPGLRALVLTGAEEGIAAAFPDVEAAAAGCRFRDCAHDGEPGCAVAAAVAAGTLPEERLLSYHKLIREAQVAAAKTDARLRAEEKRRWRTISKASKRYFKETGRA